MKQIWYRVFMQAAQEWMGSGYQDQRWKKIQNYCCKRMLRYIGDIQNNVSKS